MLENIDAHELKIIKQLRMSKHGNDCIINDTIVQYTVHGTFVVETIRRYTGWCDKGLDFRNRKEFSSIQDADIYFEELKESF